MSETLDNQGLDPSRVGAAVVEFMTRLCADAMYNAGIDSEKVAAALDIIAIGVVVHEHIDGPSGDSVKKALPAVAAMDTKRFELAGLCLRDAYGACLPAAGLSLRDVN